jgi:sulfopyruvate decarboxylase alpha subunit|tara:strand:- start:732 stop:1265 length:534 start_codon:yes stop_codon:yes gene_type:complete
MSDTKQYKIKSSWEECLFNALKQAGVKQLPYVPDAGHSKVIDMAHKDPDIRPVVLTTEEEGVALCCGAWLGGEKSVLLMQSSGVGNCINMLSLLSNCNFPFLTIVTMRGEYGEFNSWQVPMSAATQKSLELMGLTVLRVDDEDEVGPTVDAALYSAYSSDQRIAILLSQKLIGRKNW